jgi:hypothetical protein
MIDTVWMWLGFNLFLSLGVVVGILAMSVLASLLRPKTTGSLEGPSGPASLGA